MIRGLRFEVYSLEIMEVRTVCMFTYYVSSSGDVWASAYTEHKCHPKYARQASRTTSAANSDLLSCRLWNEKVIVERTKFQIWNIFHIIISTCVHMFSSTVGTFEYLWTESPCGGGLRPRLSTDPTMSDQFGSTSNGRWTKLLDWRQSWQPPCHKHRESSKTKNGSKVQKQPEICSILIPLIPHDSTKGHDMFQTIWRYHKEVQKNPKGSFKSFWSFKGCSCCLGLEWSEIVVYCNHVPSQVSQFQPLFLYHVHIKVRWHYRWNPDELQPFSFKILFPYYRSHGDCPRALAGDMAPLALVILITAALAAECDETNHCAARSQGLLQTNQDWNV